MAYDQAKHTELSIRKAAGQLTDEEEEELKKLKEEKKLIDFKKAASK